MPKNVIGYSFILVAGINPKLIVGKIREGVKILGMGFVTFV